mgnify:CR=1 FL=1
MAKEKTQYQVSTNIPYITQVTLEYNPEGFHMNIFSGNQVYRFACSPEHAKRISLLFDKKVKEYEEKNQKIEAKLPKPQKGKEGTGKSVGFKEN